MPDSTKPDALQQFPVAVRLPIQWGDLDAYGHVNNLVYLKWFETARAAYATEVGVQVIPGPDGVGAVIGSIECKYLRQLGFPGEVYSGVRMKRLSVGTITLESRIVDAELGTTAAEGTCDAVLWDYATRQPVAVPDAIRDAVEKLEGRSFSVERRAHPRETLGKPASAGGRAQRRSFRQNQPAARRSLQSVFNSCVRS